MVRIILNGCNGAMGKMLANIIAQDEQAQVVAGIDITQAADTPFPVFESIKACDVEADALIDFFLPPAHEQAAHRKVLLLQELVQVLFVHTDLIPYL